MHNEHVSVLFVEILNLYLFSQHLNKKSIEMIRESE